MRRLFLLLPLALGCRGGLEADLAELRAEIQKMEREVPPDEPLWITEGPNAFEPHIEDYSARVPDFIYNHVARKLIAMKTDEILAQLAGPFDTDAAFKDPKALRGKFWKATGTIANLEPLAVAERDLGVKTMYAGVLFADHRPILFHVADKGEIVYLGQDTVEVNGVFVKLLSYTARNGKRVDAPFLMGRRLGKYY
jgi:hypothetical protein